MSQENKTIEDQIKEMALGIADTQSQVFSLEKDLVASRTRLESMMHQYQLAITQVTAIHNYAKSLEDAKAADDGAGLRDKKVNK